MTINANDIPHRPAEKTLQYLAKFFISEYKRAKKNQEQVKESIERREKSLPPISWDYFTGYIAACEKALNELQKLGLTDEALKNIWVDKRWEQEGIE